MLLEKQRKGQYAKDNNNNNNKKVKMKQHVLAVMTNVF